VFAYERRYADDARRIAINFGDEPSDAFLAGTEVQEWSVELSSLADRRWDGRLAGCEAVLLVPAGASPQSA
jgi:hypothetical protein